MHNNNASLSKSKLPHHLHKSQHNVRRSSSNESVANAQTQQKINFSYTESIISTKTPVLFSTNNGICLRILNASKFATTNNKSKYCINFCDLERWPTPNSSTGNSKLNSIIGLTPDTSGIKSGGSSKNHSNGLYFSKAKNVRFVSEHQPTMASFKSSDSDKYSEFIVQRNK